MKTIGWNIQDRVPRVFHYEEWAPNLAVLKDQLLVGDLLLDDTKPPYNPGWYKIVSIEPHLMAEHFPEMRAFVLRQLPDDKWGWSYVGIGSIKRAWDVSPPLQAFREHPENYRVGDILESDEPGHPGFEIVALSPPRTRNLKYKTVLEWIPHPGFFEGGRWLPIFEEHRASQKLGWQVEPPELALDTTVRILSKSIGSVEDDYLDIHHQGRLGTIIEIAYPGDEQWVEMSNWLGSYAEDPGYRQIPRGEPVYVVEDQAQHDNISYFLAKDLEPVIFYRSSLTKHAWDVQEFRYIGDWHAAGDPHDVPIGTVLLSGHEAENTPDDERTPWTVEWSWPMIIRNHGTFYVWHAGAQTWMGSSAEELEATKRGETTASLKLTWQEHTPEIFSPGDEVRLSEEGKRALDYDTIGTVADALHEAAVDSPQLDNGIVMARLKDRLKDAIFDVREVDPDGGSVGVWIPLDIAEEFEISDQLYIDYDELELVRPAAAVPKLTWQTEEPKFKMGQYVLVDKPGRFPWVGIILNVTRDGQYAVQGHGTDWGVYPEEQLELYTPVSRGAALAPKLTWEIEAPKSKYTEAEVGDGVQILHSVRDWWEILSDMEVTNDHGEPLTMSEIRTRFYRAEGIVWNIEGYFEEPDKEPIYFIAFDDGYQDDLMHAWRWSRDEFRLIDRPDTTANLKLAWELPPALQYLDDWVKAGKPHDVPIGTVLLEGSTSWPFISRPRRKFTVVWSWPFVVQEDDGNMYIHGITNDLWRVIFPDELDQIKEGTHHYLHQDYPHQASLKFSWQLGPEVGMKVQNAQELLSLIGPNQIWSQEEGSSLIIGDDIPEPPRLVQLRDLGVAFYKFRGTADHYMMVDNFPPETEVLVLPEGHAAWSSNVDYRYLLAEAVIVSPNVYPLTYEGPRVAPEHTGEEFLEASLKLGWDVQQDPFRGLQVGQGVRFNPGGFDLLREIEIWDDAADDELISPDYPYVITTIDPNIEAWRAWKQQHYRDDPDIPDFGPGVVLITDARGLDDAETLRWSIPLSHWERYIHTR